MLSAASVSGLMVVSKTSTEPPFISSTAMDG